MKYEVVEPLLLGGKPASSDPDDPNTEYVALAPGEVVSIIETNHGDAFVERQPDGLTQYISLASLVPLA